MLQSLGARRIFPGVGKLEGLEMKVLSGVQGGTPPTKIVKMMNK